MLRQIRELLGYTQSSLAEKAGITQNYYTLIETGKYPSPPALTKISKIFKVRESFLAFGDITEYPFTDNFYLFNISSPRFTMEFDFLLKYIFAPSKYIDILVLIWPPDRRIRPDRLGYESCIVVRNDHNTFFLVRRLNPLPKIGVRGTNETYDDIRTITGIYGSALYETNNYVYQRAINVSPATVQKIKENSIVREDIAPLFPSFDFFKQLYEAHKSRETTPQK